MPILFGTDGVRGVANRDLTPDLALALGRAAGEILAPGGGTVVVGRDTRISGSMLEGALVAGLCSAGSGVRLAGIITSPGVSFLTTDSGARAGVMISASHNPVDDNGIKFFSDEGAKLPGDVEEVIEARMREASRDELPTGASVGRASPLPDAHDRYVAHLLATLDRGLDGLRVVLDCAYGAAWRVGPIAFERAGAEVVAIHAEPDGHRINVDCGSTSIGALAERVVAERAQLGLAFDGDADRVVAVDHRGRPVDGDHILAAVAVRLAEAGDLERNVVVGTVMSNLALRRALQARGIEMLAAPVGDRFVAAAMLQSGAVLGGEQSGHIIFGRHAMTGDGILTGLQLGQAMASSGASLSDLSSVYEPLPQVLINVEVASKGRLDQATELWAQVASEEEALGDSGRVLLRASGTEPVVRIMVEAMDDTVAAEVAGRLARAVERHLV